MKRVFKKITCTILLTIMVSILCVSLVSCDNAVKKDEAKEMTEVFLSAVESGDFEKASSYMHPEKPIDVEKYFDRVKELTGADFQNGIEIKRYTGFSSAVYDSKVGGGRYELEVNIIADGTAFEFSIEVVRNEAGYGIYSFEVDDD